jgi:hypothetical protein
LGLAAASVAGRRGSSRRAPGNEGNQLSSARVPLEWLGTLFGRQVVVSGQAVFRPSGAILRLEADAFDEADERATLWAKVPKPLFTTTGGVAKLVPQGPRSGIAAIIGKWPGDEDDDEIAKALEDIS